MKICVNTEYGKHFAWVFIEYEPGKRLTNDMVSFDTNREDVHVNKYGVVLFYDTQTARMLVTNREAYISV